MGLSFPESQLLKYPAGIEGPGLSVTPDGWLISCRYGGFLRKALCSRDYRKARSLPEAGLLFWACVPARFWPCGSLGMGRLCMLTDSGREMETSSTKAADFLQQAETLRKIADEMKASDPKSAHSLIEMAEDFEQRAGELTSPRSP